MVTNLTAEVRVPESSVIDAVLMRARREIVWSFFNLLYTITNVNNILFLYKVGKGPPTMMICLLQHETAAFTVK
jgi:hypothetical protein